MNRKFDDFSKKLASSIGSVTSLVIHTIIFVGIFALRFFNISISDILLILTTLVSLEAIYLAIFIQITVNRQGKEIEEVSEDIEEIQEDVEEIQEDVEEIQEDVEEISEDEEISGREEQSELNKFKHIEKTLQDLLDEIAKIKNGKKNGLN